MRTQVIFVATIFLNIALFGTNLFVAVIGGSKAVLSQAIYSLTDLVGSALLLWGLYASRRAPTYDHPFGYGKERFFWSFTGSLITFSLAGVIILITGFDQLARPTPVTHVFEGVLVMAATLVLSLVGIVVTLRELQASRTTLSWLLESSHLGLKTIFYQDVISIIGSIVAFFGIVVVYETGDTRFDGLAAVGAGLLMLATGLVVAAESRALLVGKSIPPSDARRILAVLEKDSRVRTVRGLQSMMLGPDDVLVALRVNFQDGLTTDQIESVIDQVGVAIRSEYPAIRHLIIEPES
jgi:cation diffusion facilitator family transporter